MDARKQKFHTGMIGLIFKNHYERLEIARDATDKEIRSAFRQLALQFHPDVASDKERGHKIFLLIKEAHAVLSDPEKRRDYDQWLEASTRFKERRQAAATAARPTPQAAPRPAAKSPPRSAAPPPRAQLRPELDTFATLEIELEASIKGGVQTLSVESEHARAGGLDHSTFDVVLPPMCYEGREIRVPGRGLYDAATRTTGSLILEIAFARHHVFRSLGNDLYAMVDIWPWDAATGVFINVPTLDGSAALKIPPGAQPWQKFSLEGQGLPGKTGGRGRLYVSLRFQFPKSVSPQQAQLWRQLKAAYRAD